MRGPSTSPISALNPRQDIEQGILDVLVIPVMIAGFREFETNLA